MFTAQRLKAQYSKVKKLYYVCSQKGLLHNSCLNRMLTTDMWHWSIVWHWKERKVTLRLTIHTLNIWNFKDEYELDNEISHLEKKSKEQQKFITRKKKAQPFLEANSCSAFPSTGHVWSSDWASCHFPPLKSDYPRTCPLSLASQVWVHFLCFSFALSQSPVISSTAAC